ncbi:MAG TPA: hypothetical protein VMJ10_19470 [Kofleriaceae bacterium]|nr:hypothetical protein [Kofleriaceae bacterium]
MTVRRAAWLVLVPALALAGPGKGKKGKATGTTTTTTTAPADTGSGSGASAGSGSGSADTKPDDAPGPAAPPPSTGAGSGSGSGSAAAAAAPTKSDEPDVDALRQEYLALRDELYKSRARANAVASQLYSTRVSIKLTWTSGRYYGVSKSSIRLDGTTVFEDDKGAIAGDDGVRFDGYIAPGKHLVTFHIEAAGKDDDAFTEATENQVTVQAVANKDLVIAARAHDSGDIAYAWKREQHGNYGLGIDVAVKTLARIEDKGAKK